MKTKLKTQTKPLDLVDNPQIQSMTEAVNNTINDLMTDPRQHSMMMMMELMTGMHPDELWLLRSTYYSLKSRLKWIRSRGKGGSRKIIEQWLKDSEKYFSSH